MSTTDDSLRLHRQAAAHMSWAKTPDRNRRTAPARQALEQKWLDMADGDPIRAEHFRKAHIAKMTAASLAARRKAREARAELAQAEAELRKLEAEGGRS